MQLLLALPARGAGACRRDSGHHHRTFTEAAAWGLHEHKSPAPESLIPEKTWSKTISFAPATEGDTWGLYLRLLPGEGEASGAQNPWGLLISPANPQPRGTAEWRNLHYSWARVTISVN